MFAKTVKTRLNKDDKVRTETKVQVDFSGCTREELEELAAATVIINEQAIWRTSGKIPSECIIKVRDQLDRPKGSFQPTPDSLAARALKMSPEEIAALIEKLQNK